MDGLKLELKELIVNECAKEVDAASIQNDTVLFEDEALELDSMDALQISMALQREYGIDITDSKVLRKVMVDINALAKFVEENRKK